MGLYKDAGKAEPHRNAKLDTWKEDLAAKTERLEEAKKVTHAHAFPMKQALHCFAITQLCKDGVECKTRVSISEQFVRMFLSY